MTEEWSRLSRGLWNRMRGYRELQRPGKMFDHEVMADLFKFCRFFSTTYDQGQTTEELLVLEGRRQVILRILAHTQLKIGELLPILAEMDELTRIALFDNKRQIPVDG